MPKRGKHMMEINNCVGDKLEEKNATYFYHLYLSAIKNLMQIKNSECHTMIKANYRIIFYIKLKKKVKYIKYN